MDITQGFYDKLVGDATLLGLIASYAPAGSPTAPAIFTAWPVPPDAARPYVFTRGQVSDVHFDEINTNFGRDVLRDVTVIADNTGSSSDVETIAERIRTLMHRQSMTIPDGDHIMTICIGGPVPAETDDSLTGRRLTFRIVVMEA